MGMTKNKDDLAIYSLRLNLTRPEHLILHQKLQGLKGGAYKSINTFLIEAVSGYLNHSYIMKTVRNEQDGQIECRECNLQNDLNKIETRLREDITKEMLAFLLTYLPEKNNGISESNQKDGEESGAAEKRVEEDDTLAALSDVWS